MVYVTFTDADESSVIKGSYWTKFCTQKSLDPLGDLAKAFIGADDYCSKKPEHGTDLNKMPVKESYGKK